MLIAMGDNAVKCQLFDMLPQLHCPLLLSIPPYRHTATECCGGLGWLKCGRDMIVAWLCGAVGVAMWRCGVAICGAVAWLCGTVWRYD